MARKTNPENDSVVSTGTAAAKSRRAPIARPKHSPIPVDLPAIPARGAEPEASLAASAGVEPSHEEIAVLAYLYWEARGCQGGSPEEDWLRAEQELRRSSVAVA